MGIQDFRSRARSIVQGAKKTGGFRKNHWHLAYRPPKMDPSKHNAPVAEPIVFIDTEYVDPYESLLEGQEVKQPFHHHKSHMFKYGPKDFRNVECSAGVDPHGAQPCIGCHQNDNGVKGPPRDKLTFNVGHLVPYHSVPLEREGSVVKKENGDTVMITKQCEGQGCGFCKSGADTIFGQHKYMQVGTGHLNNILSWDAKVANFCANCSSNIVVLSYVCGGCQGLLLDVNDSGWKAEEIADFSKSEVRCPHCEATGLPVEILDCGYDPMGNKMVGQGCGEPGKTKRLSLFEVVLYLQREGEGTDSRIVDISWCPKSQFPTPDGVPLDEALATIVPEPMDFDEMFSPKTLDAQATLLGIQNPFSGSKKFREYGDTPERPNY